MTRYTRAGGLYPDYAPTLLRRVFAIPKRMAKEVCSKALSSTDGLYPNVYSASLSLFRLPGPLLTTCQEPVR